VICKGTLINLLNLEHVSASWHSKGDASGHNNEVATAAAVEIPGNKISLHGAGMLKGSFLFKLGDEDIYLIVIGILVFAYPLKGMDTLLIGIGDNIPSISKVL